MIGLLGGTFDPVHKGHIALARAIQHDFKLEELHLIPCYIPVHRDAPHTSANDRLKMLELAIESEPHLSIDDYELKSAKACYSVESLEHIHEEIGSTQNIVFILGMDAFNHFLSWKNYSRILELCHLIVVNRPESSLSQDAALQALLKKHQSLNPQELQTKAAGLIYLHEIPPMDISATAIRESQASTGLPRVDHYIQQQKLYA